MTVLPYLEGRDFKMISVSKINGRDETKVEFEKGWIRKDHHIYLNWLMEVDDSNNPIGYLNIELDNGGQISFIVGQLVVSLPGDFEELKAITIRLLRMYGFFAAEKIWDVAAQTPYSLPIYYATGMLDSDFEKVKTRMVEKGERLEKMHNELATTPLEEEPKK